MKFSVLPIFWVIIILVSPMAYAGVNDSTASMYQNSLEQDALTGPEEVVIENVYDSITEKSNVIETVVKKVYDIDMDSPNFGLFCGVERYENGVFKELITCEGDIGTKGYLACPFSYKKIETTPGIKICKQIECLILGEAYTEDNVNYCLPSSVGYYQNYKCEDIGLVTSSMMNGLSPDKGVSNCILGEMP